MNASNRGRVPIGSFPGRTGDERQTTGTHVDVTVEPAGRDEETGEKQVRIVAEVPFPATFDEHVEWVLPQRAADRFVDAIETSLAEA